MHKECAEIHSDVPFRGLLYLQNDQLLEPAQREENQHSRWCDY